MITLKHGGPCLKCKQQGKILSIITGACLLIGGEPGKKSLSLLAIKKDKQKLAFRFLLMYKL